MAISSQYPPPHITYSDLHHPNFACSSNLNMYCSILLLSLKVTILSNISVLQTFFLSLNSLLLNEYISLSIPLLMGHLTCFQSGAIKYKVTVFQQTYTLSSLRYIRSSGIATRSQRRFMANFTTTCLTVSTNLQNRRAVCTFLKV